MMHDEDSEAKSPGQKHSGSGKGMKGHSSGQRSKGKGSGRSGQIDKSGS